MKAGTDALGSAPSSDFPLLLKSNPSPLPQGSALLASSLIMCLSHSFIHSFRQAGLWAIIVSKGLFGAKHFSRCWGFHPEQGSQGPLRELALSGPDSAIFCVGAFVDAVPPS